MCSDWNYCPLVPVRGQTRGQGQRAWVAAGEEGKTLVQEDISAVTLTNPTITLFLEFLVKPN